MALLPALRRHLPHHAPTGSGAPGSRPAPDQPAEDVHQPDGEPHGLGARVFAVQRTGAVLVALFLLAFGLLGFASGLQFFSTRGQPVLGMTTNGLLAALSVFVALVLLGAAARGPRTASLVMVVLGALFLLSAVVNTFVLGTRLNLLGFEISNVLFSVVVGLLLLVLGSYGRFSGHLPPDSPYAHLPATEDYVDDAPHTPEEFAVERAMRAAEVAVVQHTATPDQRRRVQAMAQVRTPGDRRRVWMGFDQDPTAPGATTAPGASQRGRRGHGMGIAARNERRAGSGRGKS